MERNPIKSFQQRNENSVKPLKQIGWDGMLGGTGKSLVCRYYLQLNVIHL